MNVFILEDSLPIQHRLTRFIGELPSMNIVGICAEVAHSYDKIVSCASEAVILDLQLSDGNSLPLLKQIKSNHPEIHVMVLSNHSNESNRMLALRAGADLFLDKSTSFEEIPQVLLAWQKTIPRL
ncbi:MAG: response regulator [Undibacterium sp.]|nr:response regulator [Undibacterium sp.]